MRCHVVAAILLSVLLTDTLEAQQPAAPAPSPAPAKAAPAPAGLSNEQRLKHELHRSLFEIERQRIAIAEAAIRALSAQTPALEAEFLAAMQAPAGSRWDWNRGTFVAPPAAPAVSKSSTSAPVVPKKAPEAAVERPRR